MKCAIAVLTFTFSFQALAAIKIATTIDSGNDTFSPTIVVEENQWVTMKLGDLEYKVKATSEGKFVTVQSELAQLVDGKSNKIGASTIKTVWGEPASLRFSGNVSKEINFKVNPTKTK